MFNRTSPHWSARLPVRRATRDGFTMIELMVVVAIIAALAGISLAGLSILRRQQKIASTLDLMTNVTTAVDAYLREYRRLGNATDSSDFLMNSLRHQRISVHLH